jgi:GT2 family glycosyltransferase
LKNPKVSIIVINWNGKNLLRNCLKSIKNNTGYPNFEVIVVDNAINDGSQKMIKKSFSWVKLIENKKNLGFSKANNIGIKNSKADYYFLLNNDTQVMKNWLKNIIEVAESDPKIGIIGCKLLYPNGKLQHGGEVINLIHVAENIGFDNIHRLNGNVNKNREVPAVVGAAFLIKKTVVENIGLLDEEYDPIYREETDYCLRARYFGYKIYYVADSVIIHHTGVTMERVNWKFYAWRKNTLRFILIHFPLSWLIWWSFFQLMWIGDSILRGEFFNLLRAYSDILKNFKKIMSKRRSYKKMKERK